MRAVLWEPADDKSVNCRLCRHLCHIAEGKRGICGVRENQGGTLTSLVYGRLIAQHVDPIEKKPLFHLLPASLSYSIATVGCNFRCRFCQNAEIAQMPADRAGMITGTACSPEQVVAQALASGCRSIAYTYTEPTVFFEFALDTAKLARQQGLKNIFVTNGYMSRDALDMIGPYLDAANVDLKAFNDGFYKKLCGAKRAEVMDSLKAMKAAGVLVEVTTLLIPGLNDDTDELKALAAFLVNDVGPATPWHVSRFHPDYRLTDRPATPAATLARARAIGLDAGLRYVYTGNIPGDEGENTICHQCGKTLIARWGFRVTANAIEEGKCPACRAVIEGVWD